MFSLLFEHKWIATEWMCHLPRWKLQHCPSSLLGSSLQSPAEKTKSLFADKGDGGKTLHLDHFILLLSLLSQRLISVFLLVSHLRMHKNYICLCQSAWQIRYAVVWVDIFTRSVTPCRPAACLGTGLVVCPTYLSWPFESWLDCWHLPNLLIALFIV